MSVSSPATAAVGAPQLSADAIRAGTAWALCLRILERGLGFGRAVLLARILAPGDFGTFGLALLLMAALEVLTHTGLSAALVQRRHRIEPYLDVAWTVQVLRGGLLAAATWPLASLFGRFFSAPDAVSLMRVAGLAFLFQGLTSIGVVEFQRNLEFRRLAGLTLAQALTDLAVAIVVAVNGGGAWALVLGFTAGHLARSLLSYSLHPFRPRLRLDWGKISELYRFGRWVFASGVVIFLVTQGDDVVVGKFFGIAALGTYQMAYLLSNLPATQVAHVIGQVTFPVYARMQLELPRLRVAYLSTVEAVGAVSFPIAAVLFAAAPDVVDVLLGPQWGPAVTLLRILALLGALRSVGAVNGSLFQGLGRPRLDTEVALIHLTLMAAFVYPMARAWGVVGIASAVTLPMLGSQALGLARVCGTIEVAWRDVIRRLAAPALGSLLVCLLYAGVGSLLRGPALRLLAGGAAGAFVYVLVLRLSIGRAAAAGRDSGVALVAREFRSLGNVFG